MKSKTYDEFVEKFKSKLTTDDCYTPLLIYDTLVEWAKENLSIEGKRIARPFWPGADYTAFDYEPDMVVIDNPPFSILSQIRKYYQARNIPYLLFAPHLTIFSSSSSSDTAIITGTTITFENGAKVNCSFVTNMLPGIAAMISNDLSKRLKEADKIQSAKVQLPKYIYPKNVITSSVLASIIGNTEDIVIRHDELCFVEVLDCQKEKKKAIFGKGFLVSDKLADKIAEARRAPEARRAAEARRAVVWELSERERDYRGTEQEVQVKNGF